jgi:hypothetical protein
MTTLFLALAVAIQSPDSARAARWERALNHTTDSLNRIRGATAGFRVDLGSASPDLILVRAAHVRAACGAAATPLKAVEDLLDGEVYSPHARLQQTQLRSGSVDLHRALERCEREWRAPDHPRASDADSLRAWGPYRSAQLDAALGRYLVLVRSFMKRAELVKKHPAL